MNNNSQKFSYQQINQQIGEASYLPFVPITLSHKDNLLTVSGLLDTGATVNVLPYNIGKQLGLDWESQNISINLTGNLANFESKAVLLKGQIPNFYPVKLAFAWTKTESNKPVNKFLPSLKPNVMSLALSGWGIIPNTFPC